MTEEQGRVSVSETLAVLLRQGQDFLLDQKKSQELTRKASVGETWEDIFKAKLVIQVLTEQHPGKLSPAQPLGPWPQYIFPFCIHFVLHIDGAFTILHCSQLQAPDWKGCKMLQKLVRKFIYYY